jgi:transposase
MPEKRRRSPDPVKEKLWRGIILRHQSSGLSVRAFCEREGLKDCDFLRWRRELSRRDRERSTPRPDSALRGTTETRVSPSFLPVRVVDADCTPSRPAPPIEIVLNGGLTVRVPFGFDPGTLDNVLAVLGSRRC